VCVCVCYTPTFPFRAVLLEKEVPERI
jgi:hypothetical protein